MHPGNLLGSTATLAELDLAAVPASTAAAPMTGTAELVVTRAGPITGLAGFFDVAFRGSADVRVDQEVRRPPSQVWLEARLEVGLEIWQEQVRQGMREPRQRTGAHRLARSPRVRTCSRRVPAQGRTRRATLSSAACCLSDVQSPCRPSRPPRSPASEHHAGDHKTRAARRR